MTKKKNFFCLLYFLGLILPLSLFSLYNGNPDLPEMPEEGYLISKESWLGLKVGYEGDIVFDRSMSIHTKNDSISHHLNTFQSTMNSGTFTLGFSDRVEVYTMLGSYRVKISERPNGSTLIRYNSDHALGGLIGIRAMVAYWGETRLGVDAKYFLSYPKISSIYENGTKIPAGSAKLNDREWQVGIGVSQRVSFFIPYIGFKFSQVNVKISHLSSLSPLFPGNHIRLTNKYPIGFFFGFGLAADRAFSCNLEGRIIDETAATLTADFRF